MASFKHLVQASDGARSAAVGQDDESPATEMGDQAADHVLPK
ncbi:MAG: hypothetical protein WAL16_25980 [Streptosporangiaceae bacterium]